ncbi:MAG: hypothetical protein ACYTHN_15905 [Planctomycetota bacterium]|jgi:hypothetical protein
MKSRSPAVHYLLTVILSIGVSAATTLIVLSVVEERGRIETPSVSEGGGLEDPGENEIGRSLNRDSEREVDVSKLESNVQELAGKVDEISTKMESMGPGLKRKDLLSLFQSLAEITEPGREMLIKKKMGELIDFGDQIIPLVEAFLAQNVDYKYGGFSSGGSYFKSHPSLRSVMIDLLCQVGSPRAKEIVLEIFANPKNVHDLDAIFVLCSNTNDPVMKEGFIQRIPELFACLQRNSVEDFKYSRFGHFFTPFMSRLEIERDKKFIGSLSRLVESGGVNSERFKHLFPLLIQSSPDAAFEVLSRKKEDLERGEWRFHEIMGYGRSATLARTFQFTKRCFDSLDLDEKERGDLYGILSMRVRRFRREDGQGGEFDRTREEIQTFVTERLSIEKSDTLRRDLNRILSQLKKK